MTNTLHFLRTSLALLITLPATACTAVPVGLMQPTTTYVVQANDSLAGIAEAHGVSIPALVDANQARYPGIATPSATNRLQAGWALNIPAGQARMATPLPIASAQAQSAPTAALSGAWDDALADELVQLTNAARAEAGLPALNVDAGLAEIARQRAQDIASDYSHAGLRARCGTCGENINQAGATDAAGRLMGGWLRSPGHRANLLLPDITRIGIGAYHAGGRVYAVQLFDY